MLHPRLKTAFYGLFTFLALVTFKLGGGNTVVLQPPTLADFINHLDLYLSGLLVLIEIFGRVVPTAKDSSLFNLLGELLDKLLPNRHQAGGRFTSSTFHDYTPGGAAV